MVNKNSLKLHRHRAPSSFPDTDQLWLVYDRWSGQCLTPQPVSVEEAVEIQRSRISLTESGEVQHQPTSLATIIYHPTPDTIDTFRPGVDVDPQRLNPLQPLTSLEEEFLKNARANRG